MDSTAGARSEFDDGINVVAVSTAVAADDEDGEDEPINTADADDDVEDDEDEADEAGAAVEEKENGWVECTGVERTMGFDPSSPCGFTGLSMPTSRVSSADDVDDIGEQKWPPSVGQEGGRGPRKPSIAHFSQLAGDHGAGWRRGTAVAGGEEDGRNDLREGRKSERNNHWYSLDSILKETWGCWGCFKSESQIGEKKISNGEKIKKGVGVQGMSPVLPTMRFSDGLSQQLMTKAKPKKSKPPQRTKWKRGGRKNLMENRSKEERVKGKESVCLFPSFSIPPFLLLHFLSSPKTEETEIEKGEGEGRGQKEEEKDASRR